MHILQKSKVFCRHPFVVDNLTGRESARGIVNDVVLFKACGSETAMIGKQIHNRPKRKRAIVKFRVGIPWSHENHFLRHFKTVQLGMTANRAHSALRSCILCQCCRTSVQHHGVSIFIMTNNSRNDSSCQIRFRASASPQLLSIKHCIVSRMNLDIWQADSIVVMTRRRSGADADCQTIQSIL